MIGVVVPDDEFDIVELCFEIVTPVTLGVGGIAEVA